jgi:hypothetical protein
MQARLFALLALLAVPAWPGHILGRITRGGPLADADVSVQCGSESSAPSRTGADGSYRIVVRSTGPCTITVRHGAINASGAVHSYDRPTAYDFEVVGDGGRFSLQRR